MYLYIYFISSYSGRMCLCDNNIGSVHGNITLDGDAQYLSHFAFVWVMMLINSDEMMSIGHIRISYHE